MEEKLLELLKLANTLNEKQDTIFAQIEYCADHTRKLEISIRQIKDYKYLEKCSVMLLYNPIEKLEAFIKIFENYAGGDFNE